MKKIFQQLHQNSTPLVINGYGLETKPTNVLKFSTGRAATIIINKRLVTDAYDEKKDFQTIVIGKLIATQYDAMIFEVENDKVIELPLVVINDFLKKQEGSNAIVGYSDYMGFNWHLE